MNTPDLISYYVQLLIMQYNSLPKARGMVSAFVTEAVADQISVQIGEAFDLETADGVQLDVIGKFRGARRMTPGLDITRKFMAIIDYTEVSPGSYKGLADYSQVATVDWFFRDYSDDTNPTYTLKDDEMRSLIKYLARLHSSDFSLYSIDRILFDFFGSYVTMVDNKNMTMTITHDKTHDPFNLFAIIWGLNVLPHPSGVLLTVVEV